MKPRYEIADIFRRYGDDYRQNHVMNGDQRKVMAAILACRTAQLGGHQEVCDQCGHLQNCYNSCRNRHCPKCQTIAKEKWLEKRREELLPCGYYVDSVVMQSSGYNSLPLQTIFTEYCT
jgi:hypothetical protein